MPLRSWLSPLRLAFSLVWAIAACAAPLEGQASEPLAVRVENFLVTPAHGPLIRVWVLNQGAESYEGQLALGVPAGWQIAPREQPVKLAAGEARRVVFNVQRGVSLEGNTYPLEAKLTVGGQVVKHAQHVQAATSPYFKPVIDGKPEDWNDAVPVRFTTAGKRTEIRSYWNRNFFALLVAVEEEKLERYGAGAVCDALQVAIAAEGTQTGDSPGGVATRWEYLLVSAREHGTGRCFQLAEPGTPLSETQTRRPLDALQYNAEIAVWRNEGTTYYECAIPWRPIRETIPASEGRELCFSLLVHDPEGTGLRDWGQAVGLGPAQRNRLAWSDWPGARWPHQAPFDNKIEWGFCASKY